MTSAMGRPAPYPYFFNATVFIAVVTLVRLLYLFTEPFSLYADEAQYWAWGKEPGWGYYSKPPMVAWLIAFTTQICGDGAFCTRLSSPIMHALTGFVVFALGAKLFDKRVAMWGAILYITLPGVSVSSSIISTDVALLFFWGLGMLALAYSLEGWHVNWWIMMGIVVGLGILSKYNMVLFFPSAALFFLISHPNRVYLFSIKFILMGLVALAIYYPNFEWNRAHDFVSYFHTKDNASGSGFSLHPIKFLEFFGSQFGVFGPLMFGMLCYCLLFEIPRLMKKDSYKLVLSFVVPTLFVILLISLLSRAHANWAAPIYIPATLLVTAWALQYGKEELLKASLILHLLVGLVFLNFDTITQTARIELSAKSDPLKRLRGWDAFGRRVAYYKSRYPNAAIFSNERRPVANLKYELRDAYGTPATIYKWNADGIIHDHYDLTADVANAPYNQYLLVTRSEEKEIKPITKHFKRWDYLNTIDLFIHDDYHIRYKVYLLEDFKGYKK